MVYRVNSATLSLFPVALSVRISFHFKKPNTLWCANSSYLLHGVPFPLSVYLCVCAWVYVPLPRSSCITVSTISQIDGAWKDSRKSSSYTKQQHHQQAEAASVVRQCRTNSNIFSFNVISTSVSFMVRAAHS